MNTWTIARITPHDSRAVSRLYAIVNDNEHAFTVGALENVVELRNTLTAFLNAPAPVPPIDEMAEEFGYAWLSTGQAARKFDVPAATMRHWMATDARAQKRGNGWCAPEPVVRGWVSQWRKHEK